MPKPYDHAELSEALDQGYNLSIERLAATVLRQMVAPMSAANSGEPNEHSGEPLLDPAAEPRQKRPYNRKPKDTEFDL